MLLRSAMEAWNWISSQQSFAPSVLCAPTLPPCSCVHCACGHSCGCIEYMCCPPRKKTTVPRNPKSVSITSINSTNRLSCKVLLCQWSHITPLINPLPSGAELPQLHHSYHTVIHNGRHESFSRGLHPRRHTTASCPTACSRKAQTGKTSRLHHQEQTGGDGCKRCRKGQESSRRGCQESHLEGHITACRTQRSRAHRCYCSRDGRVPP